MGVVDPRTAVAAGLLLLAGCPDEGTERDPGDGNVQPGDDVIALEIRPAHLVLDRTTSFELTCAAYTDDHYHATLDDCSFEVTEGEAVEVSADGRLTPQEVGAASLIVHRGDDTSHPMTVEVIEIGALDVRVTDAGSGAGLANAAVQVGCPDALATGTTDADGRVHLEGDFQGPVDLVVQAADRRHTVLRSVRARNVVAAVHDNRSDSPRAWAHGTVEFQEEPAVGQMALAIALTSTPLGPAFTTIGDYMPGNRDVSDFGLDVELPWNLVVHGIVDDFWAPVYEGETVLSVASGFFDLGEVLAIAAQIESQGAQAAFNVIGLYADRFVLGVHGPFDVPYEFPGTQTIVEDIEVALDMPVDREVAVTLLSPPPQFYSIDPPTVFAYRELEDDLGWIVAGVGAGTKPFSHPDADPPEDDDDVADDDDGTWEYVHPGRDDEPWEVVPLLEVSAGHELGTPFTIYGAMAVYEGLGLNGDGTMSFSPPMTGTDIVLPPFVSIYDQLATDSPSGTFGWDGPSEAVDASRAVIYYREEIPGAFEPYTWRKIEVYGPGGPAELTLSDGVMDFTQPADPDRSNTWSLDAVGLRGTDFQALVTDDGLEGLESFQILCNTRSVSSEDWSYGE
jgi:hypothetical protein